MEGYDSHREEGGHREEGAIWRGTTHTERREAYSEGGGLTQREGAIWRGGADDSHREEGGLQ